MSNSLGSPLHGSPCVREPAFAFVSRIAAVGGVAAADFAKDIGLSFQKILDGDPETLTELARVINGTHEILTEWTPSKSGSIRRILKGERFPSRTLLAPQVRGCPLCLREDAENSGLPPHRAMFFRADWLIPHVTICLEHQHSLVPLWHDPAPFSRYDTAARFLDIVPPILEGRLEEDYRETTDFDEWFDARLVSNRQSTWLDRQPLHAAAVFCRLLGYALLRHENISPRDVAPGCDWGLYQMGFEVASQGKDAVLSALLGLNKLAEPRYGPKAVFPVLYDRLSRDYKDDPDFEPFREILAEHLKHTWPLGPGDEIMGEPVTRRRLHSIRTASEETGIDPRRLRKMLAAAGLADANTPDAWAVFNAKEAARILEPLVEYMTAKSFAEAFKLSRSQFDLLVQDGILQPALADAGTKHIWDPRDGQAFIDRLWAGAETIQQAQHGWEHISKSAQRLKIRPGDIIRAIWDGRIQRIGRNAQFDGYRSVHVYHEEVVQVLGGEEPSAMSLELFAKTVGIGQPSHLNRLVRNGHTPATELRNPRTNALQLYITSEDSHAFHEKFVTLRTLAKVKGITWQKLAASLRKQGVSRFSPDGADYGNLFLKADTDQASD